MLTAYLGHTRQESEFQYLSIRPLYLIGLVSDDIQTPQGGECNLTAMSTVDKAGTVREQICAHTTASLLTLKWRQLHNRPVQ